jgi:predicted naringenin-chalcone synthase
MRAKIIALGTALPGNWVTQKEAYGALGYQNPRTWRIFENAGIDRRPLWITPERMRHLTPDELFREYLEGALTLGLKAAEDCLRDVDRSHVGSITFATTTQPHLLCPSLSYRLSALLRLPSDIEHTDMVGGGCQGGLPAICRAADNFLRTGRPGLVISTEICTATYFPAPEHDLENVVANAIFSDGAAACLVGSDNNPRHPRIMNFASEFDPQYIGYLGYRWQDGRLKAILHKDVPKVAPILAERVLKRLFDEDGRPPLKEIDHFIIHPGGVRVLDNVRDCLGIPEEKLALSRQILREQGNQSSATIGFIAEIVRERAKPGDRGLVLSFGAGFKTYAMELGWM